MQLQADASRLHQDVSESSTKLDELTARHGTVERRVSSTAQAHKDDVQQMEQQKHSLRQSLTQAEAEAL